MTEAQRLPFDHDQVLPEPEPPAPRTQLESEEDAELRRLHMLRGFGMVAGTVSSRYEALRSRDRRHTVREPEVAKLAIPIEKSLWSEEQAALMESGAGQEPTVPASPTERVISDTREIFGELPEPRRGLGIFRR